MSTEIFQNLHKINSYNKDQAHILQDMIQRTVTGLNERCYKLSQAHFEQQEDWQIECQRKVKEYTQQALSVEKNLPLANELNQQLQEMKRSLKEFEVCMKFPGSLTELL